MEENKLRTTRRDWVLLLVFFLAAAFLHGLVGHFSKQLSTYTDEWYYYSIADSLWEGRGIEVAGNNISFQKIGYSLLLSPLFSVQEPSRRVQLIGWLNNLLMMSSVFPVWFIGQEVGLRKGYRWPIMAAVFLLPEFLVTITFMAENLYYPLVFWAVWIWMVTARTQKWPLALLGGILGCFAYTVKEAFLALAAAFIILDLIRLIRTWKKKRSFDRRSLICLLTYTISFLALVAAVRFIVFSSMHYSYQDQFSFAVQSFDWWKAKYLLYAVLCYVVSTLCCTFILPFTLPLACRFRMEEKPRHFMDLVLLYIGITVAFIAFTICVPEETGHALPRFHLRYYAPGLILMLIVFARSVQQEHGSVSKKVIRRFAILSACALLLVVFLYKGNHYGSIVDQLSLASFDEIYWSFLHLGQPAAGKWILAASLAAVILVSILLIWRKHIRKAAILFAVVILAVMAGDWTVLVPRLQEVYKTYPELIEEVRAVNAALAEAPEDSTLLVLADDQIDPGIRHCIDTYLEVPCKVVAPLYVDQAALMKDGDMALPEEADFILVGGVNLASRYTFRDCDPVSIGQDLRLRFFRHTASGPIRLSYNTDSVLTEASTWEEPLEIRFYGDDYNASIIDRGGLYPPEDGFSWTAGHEVTFEIQASQVFDTVMVELDVGDPFNSEQPFEIWCSGEMVYSSVVFEPDNYLFALHPSSKTFTLSIRLPNAIEVNRVRPESGDGRCVAIQLQRMALWVDDDSQL